MQQDLHTVGPGARDVGSPPHGNPIPEPQPAAAEEKRAENNLLDLEEGFSNVASASAPRVTPELHPCARLPSLKPGIFTRSLDARRACRKVNFSKAPWLVV